MAAQKKSFTNDLDPMANPALQFISNTEAITEPQDGEEPVKFVFHKPERETMNRRLQLLIKPSLYDKVKAKADAAGASVNAYINAVLEYHTGSGEE